MSDTSGYKLLLVDDNPHVLEALGLLFEQHYDFVTGISGAEAIALVESDNRIAVVVLDIRMPDMNGIEASRVIRKLKPDLPIIFHTGYPGEYSEDEIDASEQPFDYVQKGASVSRLMRSVKNAFESTLFRNDADRLSEFAERNLGLVGSSIAMQKVYHAIRRVAATDTKVMILGETGTGKELVARSLHQLSLRASKPLVIFNCNHKAPDLVESELFGHGKGAFTGAVADNLGLFEYADKGTIFLDEIGDLDITTQAKILRVLETGEFQTIGKATELKTTDTRIVCATHRNLEEMVAEESFREDLFYRLNGIQITLPPLRERRSDIPLLIDRFINRLTVERGNALVHFDPQALDLLASQDWPGNVRQLQDCIESLIVLSDSDVILVDDVRDHLGLTSAVSTETLETTSLAGRTRQFRKQCIVEALRESDGNVSAAARQLKVDPANLRKLIANYGVESGS